VVDDFTLEYGHGSAVCMQFSGALGGDRLRTVAYGCGLHHQLVLVLTQVCNITNYHQHHSGTPSHICRGGAIDCVQSTGRSEWTTFILLHHRLPPLAVGCRTETSTGTRATQWWQHVNTTAGTLPTFTETAPFLHEDTWGAHHTSRHACSAVTGTSAGAGMGGSWVWWPRTFASNP